MGISESDPFVATPFIPLCRCIFTTYYHIRFYIQYLKILKCVFQTGRTIDLQVDREKREKLLKRVARDSYKPKVCEIFSIQFIIINIHKTLEFTESNPGESLLNVSKSIYFIIQHLNSALLHIFFSRLLSRCGRCQPQKSTGMHNSLLYSIDKLGFHQWHVGSTNSQLQFRQARDNGYCFNEFNNIPGSTMWNLQDIQSFALSPALLLLLMN